MTSSRGSLGPRVTSVANGAPGHRGRLTVIIAIAVLAVVVAATAALGETALGRVIRIDTQRYLLFYAGVFALIALTASVGIGLVATDRIVMTPPTRVVAQAVHRAVSLAALAFLFIHIVTEILASRVGVIDAFIPFLAKGRTFYIGLGTLASDMLVVIIVTGLARHRFAGTRPRMWRVIHASAYVCWFFGLLHGLLAGREGKPYVNWSYGACVAAVLLMLTIRLVASLRDRRETVSLPVPSRPSSAVPPAAMAGLAPTALAGKRGAAVPGPAAARRALPAGRSRAQDSPDETTIRMVRGAQPADYAGQPYAGRPYAPQQPYARQPYDDHPYDDHPYDDHPYDDQLYAPQQPYAGQPYPGEAYSQRYAPPQRYASEPYAAGQPHAGQGPTDAGVPGQEYDPEEHGDYPAAPALAPELWPDHPSAPMPIARPARNPRGYPPRRTDGP